MLMKQMITAGMGDSPAVGGFWVWVKRVFLLASTQTLSVSHAEGGI